MLHLGLPKMITLIVGCEGLIIQFFLHFITYSLKFRYSQHFFSKQSALFHIHVKQQEESG
jgi:hypothetical protein